MSGLFLFVGHPRIGHVPAHRRGICHWSLRQFKLKSRGLVTILPSRATSRRVLPGLNSTDSITDIELGPLHLCNIFSLSIYYISLHPYKHSILGSFYNIQTYLLTRDPFIMRAVRFHGRGDIRVDEIEEPVCGNGQVKVSLGSLVASVALLTKLNL